MKDPALCPGGEDITWPNQVAPRAEGHLVPAKARGTGPARNPRASPGTARSRQGGRDGAKYRAHTKPDHTKESPPKPYPPKAAFPEG